MRRALGLGLALLAAPAAAQSPAPTGRTAEYLCEPLIRDAEKREGIPRGLLMAIGRAEAGTQTTAGTVVWPWALNVAGQGVYAKSEAEALARVRRELAEDPGRFVDLGCMQVNWQFHRASFRDPAELLRPAMNVAYAARFLHNLAAQHGGWQKAVGFYHSGNPARQAAYLEGVARRFCSAPETAASCRQVPRSVVRAPIVPSPVKVYRGSQPPQILGGPTGGASALPFR